MRCPPLLLQLYSLFLSSCLTLLQQYWPPVPWTYQVCSHLRALHKSLHSCKPPRRPTERPPYLKLQLNSTPPALAFATCPYPVLLFLFSKQLSLKSKLLYKPLCRSELLQWENHLVERKLLHKTVVYWTGQRLSLKFMVQLSGSRCRIGRSWRKSGITESDQWQKSRREINNLLLPGAPGWQWVSHYCILIGLQLLNPVLSSA